MSKDDVIRMAREAGYFVHDLTETHGITLVETDEADHLAQLERFANLVAAAVYENEDMFAEAYAGGFSAGVAAEREACASICFQEGPSIDGELIAEAIRARGRK